MGTLASVAQEAVKQDIASRTYYWTGDHWTGRDAIIKNSELMAIALGTFKGSARNFESLPKEGNRTGDYYVVEPSTLTIGLTTAPGLVITGNPTLRGVVQGFEQMPNTASTGKGFADLMREVILRKLLDEKLALVKAQVHGRDGYVLTARTEVEFGDAVEWVKAIEVNKLYVKAVPSIDGFEVEVTYDNLPVRIDSSALQ